MPIILFHINNRLYNNNVYALISQAGLMTELM